MLPEISDIPAIVQPTVDNVEYKPAIEKLC